MGISTMNGSANGVPEISFHNFDNIINGTLRSAKLQYHGINPATKERLWPAPVATEQDVDDAVAAGQLAFSSWKKVAWKKRQQLLIDFSERVMQYEEAFTNLMILETGKPVRLLKEMTRYSLTERADRGSLRTVK